MAGSLLETTLNTRDLGGWQTVDERVTQCGHILRSDRQGHPSERDVRFLLELGVTTLIDLRGEADVQRAPSGFAGLPGFTLVHCPITEGSGVPASQDEVPRSYLRIASAPQMTGVFRTIAQAEHGVLYSCTAGKDRSGVISAILLMLCGVAEDDVIADYMRSKDCNQPRFEQLRQHFPALDMRIVIPQPRYMREFLRLFRERFGSAEAYLRQIGLTDGEIARIRAKLL